MNQSVAVRRQGFSLVELLLVIVIFSILFTVGVASYNNFNRKRVVRETALKLMNNLRFVQNKALSGEKPDFACDVLNGWRLQLSANSYQIQAICDEGRPSGNVKTYSLPIGVSLNSDTSSFLFKVLAHGVEFSGSGEVNLAGFGWTYQIKVTPSGEISDEGFL